MRKRATADLERLVGNAIAYAYGPLGRDQIDEANDALKELVRRGSRTYLPTQEDVDEAVKEWAKS